MTNLSRNDYLYDLVAPKTIHGSMFHQGLFTTAVTDVVAAGATIDIGLTTGSEQIVLSGFFVSTTSGEIDATIYGGSVFTGGSATNMFSMNDNMTFDASLATIVSAPTVTDLGSQKTVNYVIRGEGGNNLTTDFYQIPYIFAPNTSYLFRVTNNDSSSDTIDLVVFGFKNIITPMVD